MRTFHYEPCCQFALPKQPKAVAVPRSFIMDFSQFRLE